MSKEKEGVAIVYCKEVDSFHIIGDGLIPFDTLVKFVQDTMRFKSAQDYT